MENNNKLSEEEIKDIIKTKYSSKDDKTKEFIRKALRKHGNVYDYSKTVYTLSHNYVIITCYKHGDFQQFATDHLNGSGCKKCGEERASDSKIMGAEEFIRRSKEIHKDKYNYDKVKYVKGTIPVIIHCNKHNIDFEQRPCDHLLGKGCPECAKESIGDKHRLTKEEFIRRATELHPNNEYGYEKVVYKNIDTEVIIIDHLHNDEEFSITPHNFLRGQENPKYKNEKRKRLKLQREKEKFIKKAKERYNDQFDYSEVDYKGTHTPVRIFCKKCNSFFEQTPHDHLIGSGCKNCSEYKKSKGEGHVSIWLTKNNIDFTHDQVVYGVDGRKSDHVYPDFQFTLDNVMYWVEYNGPQHYKLKLNGNFKTTIEDFEKQLKRDIGVREYCRNNNITLIEIPYTINTLNKVCDFLTQVLINKVDPNTIINYKELYELTEDISFGINDLLL